jgi:hypothetical protein
MSDIPQRDLDPTESIRTIQSKQFKETYMTLREHQDTDKHYIGDALPVPSDEMANPSGINSDSGESAFPARADHSHGTSLLYSVYVSSGEQTIPPGSAFINNLNIAYGKDMRISGQLIKFPEPGLYLINCAVGVRRAIIDNFVNEMNVSVFYRNGSAQHALIRQSNFDIPQYLDFNFTDTWYTSVAPTAAENMQIQIQHNDSEAWYVGVQYLAVFRLCGIESLEPVTVP